MEVYIKILLYKISGYVILEMSFNDRLKTEVDALDTDDQEILYYIYFQGNAKNIFAIVKILEGLKVCICSSNTVDITEFGRKDVSLRQFILPQQRKIQ